MPSRSAVTALKLSSVKYQHLAKTFGHQSVGYLACFIFGRQAKLIESVRCLGAGWQVIQPQGRYRKSIHGAKSGEGLFLKRADHQVNVLF